MLGLPPHSNVSVLIYLTPAQVKRKKIKSAKNIKTGDLQTDKHHHCLELSGKRINNPARMIPDRLINRNIIIEIAVNRRNGNLQRKRGQEMGLEKMGSEIKNVAQRNSRLRSSRIARTCH